MYVACTSFTPSQSCLNFSFFRNTHHSITYTDLSTIFSTYKKHNSKQTSTAHLYDSNLYKLKKKNLENVLVY